MTARRYALLVAASLTLAACSGGGQGWSGAWLACPDVTSTVPPAAETAPPSGPLRADSSGRFVLTAEGAPFFWLGDTAWMVIGRALNRRGPLPPRSAREAVQRRADLDAGRNEDEAYWRRVDYLVDQAASLGMYVAIVPCWHCFEDRSQGGRGISDEDIRAYGRFLGSRYGDRYVNWLLGGDGGQDGVSAAEHARYTLLANSIASAAGGHDEVFIGFQPSGATSSSTWFHADAWLDFNTLQSGHEVDFPSHDLIAQDYGRMPVKPTHEGESIYEGIAQKFWESVNNPRATAWDARKGAYWGVFAGGFGHTHGAEGVWDWTREGEVGRPNCCTGQPRPWYEAIAFPGSSQMQHLRRLIESRPFLIRVPDQSIVTSDAGGDATRVQATRGCDGSYAFVYVTDGHAIAVDMGAISGEHVEAWWFDPRTGVASPIGTFTTSGEETFTPPSSGPGNDWVLVLDDATRGFGTPGAP